MDMELTDVRIRAAKPQEKPYKLRDGKGLVLLIKPNGSRLWRLRYEIDGVEKGLSLGAYPEVSLKLARERRDNARRLIADGTDPSAERKAENGPLDPKTVARMTKRFETFTRRIGLATDPSHHCT